MSLFQAGHDTKNITCDENIPVLIGKNRYSVRTSSRLPSDNTCYTRCANPGVSGRVCKVHIGSGSYPLAHSKRVAKSWRNVCAPLGMDSIRVGMMNSSSLLPCYHKHVLDGNNHQTQTHTHQFPALGHLQPNDVTNSPFIYETHRTRVNP